MALEDEPLSDDGHLLHPGHFVITPDRAHLPISPAGDDEHVEQPAPDPRENRPRGTLVGTFSAPDPNHASDHFRYRLVRGPGSADNRFFRIVGRRLKTAARFDYEAKSSYAIRVRVIDSAGRSTVQTLTIGVNNVPE
jgi:Cadherin domain